MDCKDGKCHLRNQTVDKVIEFMSGEDMMGFTLYLLKDQSNAITKYIKKDLTYSECIVFNENQDSIGFKFFPYGYDLKLDEMSKLTPDGLIK